MKRVFDKHESIVAKSPPHAMLAIGRVRAFGIKKYPADHWATLPVNTHLNSALRHVFRFMAGELADPESGEHPLAHAALRLMMALDILMAKGGKKR